MSFNFLDTYKDYSNIELLKIIKQPENFQAKAVEAAQLLLESRNVLAEEINVAEKELSDKEVIKNKSKEKYNTIINESQSILEDIINPAKDAKQKKWFKIIIVIYTLLLIRLAISNSYFLYIFYFKNNYQDIGTYYYLIEIFYPFVILYFFIKKFKSAWTVMFIENLLFLVLSITSAFQTFEYFPKYPHLIFGTLFNLSIRTSLIILLLKPDVQSIFNINANFKKNTVMIIGGLIVLYLFYYFVIATGTSI